MKVMKSIKLKLFGMLAIMLLSYATASAGYYLPESTLWEGNRTLTQEGISFNVEYAVYDTHDYKNGYHDILDGLTNGFVNPGSGQYIYAYEVTYLDSTSGNLPISAFQLVGGDPSKATGIGTKDNGTGGIKATNNGSSFVWNFANSAFVANKHSVFMVFSSDLEPKKGEVKISTDNGDPLPVNGTGTPEPATAAMLAVGGIITTLMRRNKK